MATQVADYQIVGTVLSDGVLTCLAAARPQRLGDGPATVWALGPVGRAPWPAARARLEALAGVRSQYLPEWLEMGTADWEQKPVIWVSSSTVVSTTLASQPPQLDLPAKLRALAQAALGAHALHERGQLHGSICPQAVALVGSGGDGAGEGPVSGSLAGHDNRARAVLAPPSIADGQRPLLHVGYPPLSFVDPQLARGEGGRWSDVWAVGAVAQYVATGSGPLPGLDGQPVVRALAELIGVPEPHIGDMPPAIGSVVATCLARDPQDRPSTCEEAANLLMQAAAKL